MDIKITGLDDLQRKLDKMAKAAQPEQMATRIRATRCPDHGTAIAQATAAGHRIEATFCCDKARAIAMKATTDGIFDQ